MQTLWSRAIQARCTCKCTSCLTTTSSIARRASIATSRRLLKPTPSSTFLYSTIFAAAVVVDAKAKRERREKWDAAIASAKEDLEHSSDHGIQPPTVRTSIQGSEGLEKRLKAAEAYWSDIDAAGIIDDVVGMRFFQDWNEDGSSATPEFLAPEIAMLQYMFRFDHWGPRYGMEPENPVTTAGELDRDILPPQSLWASEKRRNKAVQRSWWTKKKMRMSEAQTARLILTFLHHANLFRVQPRNLGLYPETLHELISMNRGMNVKAMAETGQYIQRLQRLPHDLQGDLPDPLSFFPRYNEDLLKEHYSIRASLNASLRNTFDLYEANEITFKTLIATICHNLLVSSAAPDVRTYNILLTSFLRMRSRKNVDQFMLSAIHNIRWVPIRPNEITCATILEFYTQTNRLDEFNEFLDRMRCQHEENGQLQGLMSARPDLVLDEFNEDRLVRVTDDRVIQKVPPTPLVFSSVMKGMVRFFGMEEAMCLYNEWSLEGWGLDVTGFSVLLRDALERRDWDYGLSVWNQIQKLQARRKEHLELGVYEAMLALCSACKERSAYMDVFAMARNAGYRTSDLTNRAFHLLMATPSMEDRFSTPPNDLEERYEAVVDSDTQDQTLWTPLTN